MNSETMDLTDSRQEPFIETNFIEDLRRRPNIEHNVAGNQSYSKSINIISNKLLSDFKRQNDKILFPTEETLNDNDKLRISVTQKEKNLLKIPDIIELSDDEDEVCENEVVLEGSPVEIIDISDDESHANNDTCQDNCKEDVMSTKSDENEIMVPNFIEFDYHSGLPIKSTYLQPLSDLHESILKIVPEGTIENNSTENSNIPNIKFKNVDSSKHFQQTNCESAKGDKKMGSISEEDNSTSQENDSEIIFHNFEDIRKKIKLQLTSLRMGKKEKFLKSLETLELDEKLKERCQNNDVNRHPSEVNKNPIITSLISKEFVPPKNFQTALPIPDEEFKSKIPVNAENPIEENNNEDDDVFNEINKTRISPRISSDLEPFNFSSSSVSKCSNQSRQLSSISFENNNKKSEDIKSDIYKNSTSNSISSPFVSDNLDEFLTDAKLNVSYAIQKNGVEEGLTHNYSFDAGVTMNKKTKKEECVKPKEKSNKSKALVEKRKLLQHSHTIEEKRFKSETKQVTSPPSRLKELKEKTCPLKYKPGPLCKKHLLQYDPQCKSEQKSFPKPDLQMMPQVGKTIEKKLISCVNQWDWMVSNVQIDLSLSAFASKTDVQKTISAYDSNYQKNQESTLIKKKIENEELESKIPIDDVNKNIESAIQNDVAKIIDNLINYVEIKEIAESLIKEDENFHENFSENVIPPEKPKDNTRKRLSRKLTRTSRELKKLNCKMITVDVESNKTEDICLKPYCKLGCICNSLRCNTLIGLHCRQSKCIFQCICSHNKYIVNIPSSIDAPYLSSDAVSVIENEAKKNLAKEEKEFTQTIIYSNENAIVVEMGNKLRRAARMPKKYVNFYNNKVLQEKSVVRKKHQSVKPFKDVNNYDVLCFSQINNV
ncbi:hypothetical protein ABEB36_005311 [Hypothenemus hampei]|uniref:MGA conserved domain-containing protein n=1 Tax=Hypothenemus hampei TaxID=57062 RepID=A0ABD1EXX3_HYPHA